MRLACLLLAAYVPLPGACVIAGKVQDTRTGDALPHARVFARGFGDTPAILRLTDAQGAFCFEQLAPNTYEMVAEKAGYLVSLYGARPGSDDGIPFEVEGRTQIPPITIRMLAGATIAGTVLDPDGQPLTTLVELSRKVWDKRWTSEKITHTGSGDDGSFHFDMLTPGTYYLAAMLRLGPPRGDLLDGEGQPIQQKEVGTFYAGSYTFERATPIPLKAGQQQTGLMVSALAPASRHLSGSLSAELLEAAVRSNSTMQLQLALDKARMGATYATISEDGKFSVDGLVPGEYSFGVFGFNPGARGKVDLTDGDVNGFVIEAQHEVTFQVSVRVEGGGPAPVRLQAAGRQAGYQQSQHEEGGFYRFSLTPDVYSFDGPGGPGGPGSNREVYVKRLLVEGRPQPDLLLDLRQSAPAKVELVLTSKTAELEGRLDLRKGETHELAITVVAVDEARSGPELKYQSDVADHTGEFALGDLPPGKWRVFAIEGFEEGPWGSPELAAALREKSVEVELQEGRTATVKLPVIGAEEWEAALRKVGM